MRENTTVQFVCFETALDTEPFIQQWELCARSVNSDQDVTLQQSPNNGAFRYIAQHHIAAGELEFFFRKPKRSSRIAEVEVKTKLAGGYSILQAERMTDALPGESKVFAFLPSPADLSVYRQLSVHSKLNIYEAYYENCQYAAILEFFTENKYAAELCEQLKQCDVAEVGIYNECVLEAV